VAYATTTPASQDALISDLMTFATTTDGSWTQDQLDTSGNEAALHHTADSDIYVSFEWDETDIGVHIALGYTGGNSPGNHPNDSGNGGVGSGKRRVAGIGNGAFTAAHFFSNFTATADFIYVVLEYSAGLYRHFGFGELDKVGDWTGGEFAYGHEWDQLSQNIDTPTSSSHSWLLDGGAGIPAEAATIHMEGFQDAPASSRWGVVGIKTLTPGNDGDANGRYVVQGGGRAGPYANSFAIAQPSVNTGLVPAWPVVPFAYNATPSPDRAYKLGFMPDCRVVNMKNFSPGQELTIGGQTWKVFPAVRKQFLKNDTEESWNMGVMYRKA